MTDVPDLESKVADFIRAAAQHAEAQLSAARDQLDGVAAHAARDFAAEAKKARADAQAAVAIAEEAVRNAENELRWWSDGGAEAREAAQAHVTAAHEQANAPTGDVQARAGVASAAADAPQAGG